MRALGGMRALGEGGTCSIFKQGEKVTLEQRLERDETMCGELWDQIAWGRGTSQGDRSACCMSRAARKPGRLKWSGGVAGRQRKEVEVRKGTGVNIAAFGGGCEDLGLPQSQMQDPGGLGLEEIHNLSSAALETACRGSKAETGQETAASIQRPHWATEVLRRPGNLVEPRIS